MGRCRRKKIEHHLPAEEIDEMLREAEDDDRLRRIGFVNLVLSACLAAAGYVLAVGSAGDANPPQILH